MQNQLKSLGLMLCRFSTEHGKPRKRFINIAKMLEQQKSSQQTTPPLSKTSTPPVFNSSDPSSFFSSLSDLSTQQPTQVHLSPQQQQINHRIRTAIRSQSLYHQCTKNKHKLQPRHYSLMFCKLLQLRKSVPKERKETEGFANFLNIIQKKLDKMAPEELVRIVFAMKHQSINKQQLKLCMPILQKIVNQFSNKQNSELQPKSYETLKLSTSIKLFHSFMFLLQQTGSHFEAKLKLIMNETLNYILFRAMRTKKHTKSGEYVSIGLKMSFLTVCADIGASPACIKNLILSILVEKDKLQLGTLLQLENAIFSSPQVLERSRRQLFIEKDIHLKYNILNRIEHYIQEKIPNNLKKISSYSLLTRKLVRHLQYVSELTFEELNVMEMNSHRDEQIFRVLTLFHQAYRNCLIENFASINEKDQAMDFFRKSEQQDYALYELLKFFYLKLKNQGVNAIRPSTKKELKDFVGLLTKFYGKLNFLTQSILIELLLMSNFINIKSVMTEYLQINTFVTAQRKAAQRAHFFVKDKPSMVEKFFEMVKYSTEFRENCPLHYEVFMKSNFKPILKHIFKSNQKTNIEKYAFYLVSYCKSFNQADLKSLIDQVVNMYVKQSWSNRAFRKDQVDMIYKNQDYFLAKVQKNDIEMQNQTDIFGQNVLKKQQAELIENQRILSTLENDREVMREFFDLEQKIRQKIRNMIKNFKFVILFLENLKLNLPKDIHQHLITEELYNTLLANFKTEIECMKFERLLTKQNCSEVMEIYEFFKDAWDRTLSSVEVRNEFAIHHNEKAKEKQNKLAAKQTKQASNQQNLVAEKQRTQENKQSEQVLDEQEEQSEEGEYTEEIQQLKGKNLLSLETVKNYNEKQAKSLEFFKLKNKECLTEIQNLTKDFTELPKDMQHLNSKIEILKNLSNHYSLGQETESNIKVVNLAFLDETKIAKSNMNQVLSIQAQNNENRVIYGFKVYQKQYPTLEHITLQNKGKDLESKKSSLDRIFYVASSKMRRNKKRMEEMNQINSREEHPKGQSVQNKDSKREDGFSQTLGQNQNKQSL